MSLAPATYSGRRLVDAFHACFIHISCFCPTTIASVLCHSLLPWILMSFVALQASVPRLPAAAAILLPITPFVAPSLLPCLRQTTIRAPECPTTHFLTLRLSPRRGRPLMHLLRTSLYVDPSSASHPANQFTLQHHPCRTRLNPISPWHLLLCPTPLITSIETIRPVSEKID